MTVSSVFHTNILLADYHVGEQFFFKDALEKIPGSFNLTVVRNGVELMDLLNHQNSQVPDVLFLELIMPLKDGFECLAEINKNQKLKQLKVIIFSTFNCHAELIEELYKNGAQLFVRKPEDITEYKTAIYQALQLKKTHK